jgi:hypothetical protein
VRNEAVWFSLPWFACDKPRKTHGGTAEVFLKPPPKPLIAVQDGAKTGGFGSRFLSLYSFNTN